MVGRSERFTLLDWLYSDTEVEEMLGFEATVAAWTRVEIALAEARHDMGEVSDASMEAIRALHPPTAEVEERLRAGARLVGYPIIALVDMLNEQLPTEHRGILHLGATTQDIMDTAQVLQMRQASVAVERRLVETGDAIAALVAEHQATVMPGRTHGQMAVPTTFGLKMSVFLGQVGRGIVSLRAAVDEASVISLHGAAGTSAALGPRAGEIRRRCAAILGLAAEDVAWHVARDRLLGVTMACSAVASTLVRLGREVVDLSRTEVDEVRERSESHRGASSTMPQKRNPISSEALIGMGLAAQAAAGLMLRAAEAGHERAAGEWQAEWRAVPDTLLATASAASVAAETVAGLFVVPERMRRNLALDHGLILSEAAMVELAVHTGRDAAHDLVYESAQVARREGLSLSEAIARTLVAAGVDVPAPTLGQALDLESASRTCRDAIAAWRSVRGAT